ncbi:MAG: hypothetical protein OJF49_001525 [Ktedonobacterales bacterium]|jgi:hypothetical protein|nr:MAG: hypothetical protein OJF49_001525 [Ktedonobacterales bacterium]
MNQRSNREPLETFGEVLMKRLRDRAISFYDGLAQNHWKAPALGQLQANLASLDKQQQTIVRQCLIASLDAALHDFLFFLQEETDYDDRIKVVVDGVNVATLSDGMHGELFGANGWFAKYSAYKEPFNTVKSEGG